MEGVQAHTLTLLHPLLYMKGREKATPVRTTAKTIMVRWSYRKGGQGGGLFKYLVKTGLLLCYIHQR